MTMNERRENSENFKAIASAVERGRVDELQALLDAGANLNELDWFGEETALAAGYEMHGGLHPDGLRVKVPDNVLLAIRLGCERGAQFQYGEDREREMDLWCEGPLVVSPICMVDIQITAMLLMQGLDPNWSNKREFPWQHRYPNIPFGDSVLNGAITHYEERLYGVNEPLPAPDYREQWAACKANSLAWIEFLDKLAMKHRLARPGLLYLLHDFGARFRDEYRALIKAQPDWCPPPPEDAMVRAIAGCKLRGDADSAAVLENILCLCREPLPTPSLVRPKFSRNAWKTAVLTSAQILNRPGWTWPMIHRLLKEPDGALYRFAERKEFKYYRLVRVRKAEQGAEFKRAQERRAKRQSPPQATSTAADQPMVRDTSQLIHFAHIQWVEEDGDGINLVFMDPEREAIEAAFLALMQAHPTDADGRYSDAALQAAWLIATKNRPQMTRWLDTVEIATARGDTCAARRQPFAYAPEWRGALPQRLGVVWSSPASESAVRKLAADWIDVWPSFLATGNYYRSERPEAFIVEGLAPTLETEAWTLHCSGMEGPITLLARLDKAVFVLPTAAGSASSSSEEAAATVHALPQTMRWLLWTAHLLDFPYAVVGTDGQPIPSPAAHLAGTPTAAAVEAARAARTTFTHALTKLRFEFAPGGSGLFVRDRSLPLDLLDVPFSLAQRLARWQEWGEELFAEARADEVSGQVRGEFREEGERLAMVLRAVV